MIWVGGFGSPPSSLRSVILTTKYQKLTRKLAAQGADNPRALAAWIGRKKLGKAKFQAKAAAGRRRSG